MPQPTLFHPGPPDEKGPTWFTALGNAATSANDYEYRVSLGDTWLPVAHTHLGPDTWVQVRMVGPDATDTLWTTTGGEADHPVTFAELHAMVDARVGTNTHGSDSRRRIAAAIWELFTP